MKKFKFYLGIDISKLSLDYYLTDESGKTLDQGKIDNHTISFRKFFSRLSKHYNLNDGFIVVFENTGIYSNPLACFLSENQYSYSECSALEIKRSRGLSRGKSERVDAKQISLYALRNIDRIQLSVFPEKLYQQLKLFNTEREKFLAAIKTFSRTGEAEEFLGTEIYRVVKTINRQTLSVLKKQLSILDDKIASLIRGNEDLKQKPELLKSIPGVGEIGSIHLLLVTKGFTRFKNWRKFACYCGIAPFEYSSGSSVRGRNRVNPLADKKMKALLHLLSLTTIKYDEELKIYYNRKKDEGKHSLLALNNVKCKLVSRIFAVIQRGTPFVKTHQFYN